MFVVCLANVTGTYAQAECDGPFKGKKPTKEELAEILKLHGEWSRDRYPEGDDRRINLCGANLRWADFRNANLVHANLSQTDLREANLSGASVTNANLSGANLNSADLSQAVLRITKLFDANLSLAKLIEADLSDAQLSRANLSGAKLIGANLSGANLSQANLSQADLFNANLSRADLIDADLRGAKLSSARLVTTNLRGASLSEADLSGAELDDTNLEDAKFGFVDLTDAIYEPSTAPSTGHLSHLNGVMTVTFRVGKHSGLVQLRRALQEAGIRRLEREATYALNRGITRHAFNGWYNENEQKDGILLRLFTEPLPILGGVFRTLLFEWPTGWGLYYGRSVKILFALIILMSFVHLTPLVRSDSKETSSGIYRIWPRGRIEKVGDKYETAGDEIVERLHPKGWAAIRFALYFSVLSAFQIGWRDLNVGSWIARLQSQEYFLRGRGWIRSVSGAQSLVSVYLLAMWALAYFRRPFQ